jgi:hypothetical protein
MPSWYGWRDLRRCFVICAVVGSALVSINMGPQALISPPPGTAERARMALNFAVPFTVASASALLANWDRIPKVSPRAQRSGRRAWRRRRAITYIGRPSNCDPGPPGRGGGDGNPSNEGEL